MAKNFKQNIAPAMQFLSFPDVDAAQDDDDTPAYLSQRGTTPPPPVQTAPYAPSDSTAPNATSDAFTYDVPFEPPVFEARSRRVQLLIKPSRYRAVADRAKRLGVSVNELINSALDTIV